MRGVSKKRKREIDAARESRDAFAREFPRCWICNEQATDIHEIPRGPARRFGYADRRAWLRLCRKCHDLAGDYSKLPLPAAYLLKLMRDPGHYDRRWLNITRGREPDAITEQHVRSGYEWFERTGILK